MDIEKTKTENANAQKKEKAKEAFSNVLKKTSEVSKKAATEIQKGAKSFSEKVKQDSHDRRLKKYNPLFLKEFKSKDFNLPNIIKIVDDAVRRDIDVCEGAIGWRDKENGMEVLYLYDEAVKASGIEFIPNVSCDQIYYVDRFKRNKFINVEEIFGRSRDEKLAELKHIAYSLGAKSCLIEIVESSSETYDRRKKSNSSQSIQVVPSKASHEAKVNTSNQQHQVSAQKNAQSGTTRTYFKGNDVPTRPELKWFANDDIIKRLIEMRCSDKNSICSDRWELNGSKSSTMALDVANTIDAILTKKAKSKSTLGVQVSSSLSTQVVTEKNSKLIFEIEF